MVNDEKFGKLFKDEKKDGEDSEVSDKSKSDQFFDWLHGNMDLLEKRNNGKYYPSEYIVKEFFNNTAITLNTSTARSVIRTVRKELKA
jgi:hypothetical protein